MISRLTEASAYATSLRLLLVAVSLLFANAAVAQLGEGSAEGSAEGAPSVEIAVHVDRVSASRGDVLTYVVTVHNATERSFIYDPQFRAGGVIVSDAIPASFRLVPESAVARIKRAGEGTWESVGAGVHGQLLVEIGAQRNGDFTALDLPAGAQLEVRYLVAVGSDTAVGRSYRNQVEVRAWDTRAPLSGTADVAVRVVRDAVFDEGVLMGRAFCDEDGDGRHSRGESGLPGARIYLDTGSYAETDGNGQFHFGAIGPGLHLVKIDTNTLPVGSSVVSDEARAFDVTPGIPTVIDFGIDCTEHRVTEIEVLPGDPTLAEAARLQRQRMVEVTADVGSGNLGVADNDVPFLRTAMRLSAGERVRQEPVEGPTASVDGASDGGSLPVPFGAVELTVSEDELLEPLSVMLEIPGTADLWVFEIVEADSGRVVWARRGETVGQQTFSWDGRSDTGGFVLASPATYMGRLHVFQGASRSASPLPYEIRVVETRPRYLFELREHGELFADGEPGPDLSSALDSVRDELVRSSPHAIVVDVHLDDREEESDPDAVSDAQADAVARYLVEVLGVDASRIRARGWGTRRPLYPNIGDRTRSTNRRVEVRVLDPEPERVAPEPGETPTRRPGIGLGERFYPAPEDGRLELSVLKPSDGIISATMTDAAGHRATTLVALHDRVSLEYGTTVLPEVPVEVNLESGTITVGGRSTPLGALAMRVGMIEPHGVLAGRALDPILRFPFSEVPGDVRSWKFEVFDVGGALVFEEAGQGPPPGGVRWQGRTSDGAPLTPGDYEARLTVGTPGGGLATTPAMPFVVYARGSEPPSDPSTVPDLSASGATSGIGAVADAPRAPIVRVNGSRVDGNGVHRTRVRSLSGATIVVDVLSGGGRIVVPVEIPDGFGAAVEGRVPIEPHSIVLGAPSGGDAASGADSSVTSPESESDGGAAPAPDGPAGQPEPSPAPDSEPSPAPDSEPSPERSPFSPVSLRDRSNLHGAPAPRFQVKQSGGPFNPFSDSPTSTTDDTESGGTQPDDTDSDGGVAETGTGAAGFDENVESSPPGYGEVAERYAAALDAALSTEIDDLAAALARSEAAQISVQLPPPGVMLPTNRLSVYGSTSPRNRVFINGAELQVDRSTGAFETVVTLPGGPSTVLVETEDVEGNRGRLEWPVEVAGSSLFLMALGDTGVGTRHAEVAGATSHNSRTTDGGMLLYGQARLYLKGWVSGREILDGHWDDIEVTAYVDTARQRQYESFVRETIQPDRQYPVYGDASEEVAEVNARGKVYVLVTADESSATWGNFNTNIQGVELLRYERNLYGAQIALDETIGENFRTELRAHVADEQSDVAQTYNFLRGTGGSIYYLDHRQVVEGSERVAVVVRDAISGVELARIPQSRNDDYTIRYGEGRIIMKSPLPSVADDRLLLGHYATSRSTLDGHAVYLEVRYDYEGGRNPSDLSYGVHARETIHDWVSVGGGVVEESRADGPGYRLWGVEAGVGPTDSTRIDVEYARSESADVDYTYSDDGGLTFEDTRLTPGEQESGSALLLRGAFELADVVDTDREQLWSVDGYYQEADRGFFSNGRILDQGQEKFGVASRLQPGDAHRLSFRLDRVAAHVEDLSTFDVIDDLARLERQVINTQYDYLLDPARFSLSYERTDSTDPRLADPYSLDVVGAEIHVRIARWLRAGVGQEVIVGGNDPRILRGSGTDADPRVEDRFITSVTAGVQVTDELELVATERFRYSGEHSAIVGLNAAVDDASDVYVQQRFASARDNRGGETTTVVGGEQRVGADGSARTYGEYHMDNGVSGQRTRAVLGFGKRWEIVDGFSVDVGFERSQTLAAISYESESTRSTGSLGWQFVGVENLKLSGLFEARFDNGSLHTPAASPCLGADITGNPAFCRDRNPAVGDRRQLVALTSVVATPTDDVTVFARFDLITTENTTLDLLESRDVEATLGAAVRPVDVNWVNLLTRYTFLGERAPRDLELEQRRDDSSHVFSLSPVFELPFNLQLVEKVAVRHRTVSVEGMPSANNLLVLLANRLNYRVFRKWDVGAEYRFLHQSLTRAWRHGLLLDVNYIVAEHVRLGVGYNFTKFAEDELGDFDRDNSGVFFRVAAQY